MRVPRQFGTAAIIAVVSACLVLGGLTLALSEGYLSPLVAATATQAPPSPSPLPLASPTATPTASQTPTLRPTITIAPTNTPPILSSPGSLSPTPTQCVPPAGWSAIQLYSGDTLASVATRYKTTQTALLLANCLRAEDVKAGITIYVPPISTSTTSSSSGGTGGTSGTTCVPGAAGWSKSYVVAPGDTLFRIASNYYTTVTKLKQVNCRTSDLIKVGEVLWVPNVATRTPIFGYGAVTPHPTDPLTETPLPFTGTPLPFTATPT